MDSHSPHVCSTWEYTPSKAQSIGASPPSLGLGNMSDQELLELHSWCYTLSGRNQFPVDSLTWKEILTYLTTYLFNHGPNNPFLQPLSTQFSHGEDNHNTIPLLAYGLPLPITKSKLSPIFVLFI
jgi:hypothetical protein